MANSSEKKPRPKGDTKSQYQRRKARQMAEQAIEEAENKEDALAAKEVLIKSQLVLLERRTKGIPTDADADIDFAYRNMALDTAMPIDAPSLAAWSWYVSARNDPTEFLKITQKREDDKTRRAGTITNQRIEDDKRQQFAILDRIEKQLTIDVKSMVKDLMEKFPREALRECRKYTEAWDSFLAEECK